MLAIISIFGGRGAATAVAVTQSQHQPCRGARAGRAYARDLGRAFIGCIINWIDVLVLIFLLAAYTRFSNQRPTQNPPPNEVIRLE